MTEATRVALADLAQSALALRPPRRISVSEGAAATLMLKRPGDAATPWSAADTPYMVEPMNMLASRSHSSVCFVGPAQCGKTAAFGEGWVSHAVVNDPGDMLIVQMTEAKAREYSRQRVDRALEHSPELKRLKSALTDNLHDKMFKHGMWLKIAWPTVTNLSSTSYRYVFLTDYDRMPANIDGEGDAFSLGLKRTTTFLSRGMCGVESSPGYPLEDPHWRPTTSHEAPPTGGILSIYNTSDRRRWYWKCLDCHEWFEAAPGLSLFNLPDESDLVEAIREADIGAMAKKYSCVICPHCGVPIEYRWRYRLNQNGRWLQDGLRLTADDEVVGSAMTSVTAGFWLGGVAAAYQSWESLVTKYLQALRTYVLTGDELALQTTTNTDQGMPYMSRLLANASKHANDPSSRKDQTLARYVVPDDARFIVATVDNQGGTNARFVVQVHAVGKHMEKWPIDRFNITESKREGVGGGFAPIDPARYPEDWDLITDKVVRATYRTTTPGVEMRVKLVVVDSGGEDGVTDKAYDWFRRIRRAGLSSRVMLIKGVGRDQKANFPFIKETLVGNRNPKEKGDIPLYLLNTNALKDAISHGLKRQFAGPGYIHMPGWVNQAFLDELQSEVRQPNGTWAKVRKRNEAWDLLYYCQAGCLRLGADRIKWDVIELVPHWARPLDMNSERVTREERREEKENEPVVETAAQDEPRPVRRVAQRRVSRSGYVRG